ncbi:AAA family ATPase [Bacilliculturomica massiliensis]|uniref:AAA family ATPase n=1 Tax=Bacilliculturomica massiliensis TaxID=1917867 RepID=UPI0010309595|nr:AAA family ATPase [Bacilliculturomica massiliensis]
MAENRSKVRPLPIGVDSFEDLITNGYYYVDKTGLIKDLLDLGGKVNLFTRPRRFGKTLNMTMLRSFFEIPKDESAAEKQRELFSGLNIARAGETYTAQMGRYPVIFLTLKSGKQNSWELARASLYNEIEKEFGRHSGVVLSSELDEASREQYRRIMQKERREEDYLQSLQFLSACLESAYGSKTIILIDEYDVPLESAYAEGYYKEMADFIRSLFESALKSNESLAFAALTGCLRITKESIFTGLNNLEIFSVASYGYAEHFGFTPKEVEEALRFYGKEAYFPEVKEWYDGYLFGDTEVYNPWSVVNHLKQMTIKEDIRPKAYWANTSGNTIVRTLIEKADAGVRAEIEELMAGGAVEKPVHEDITYDEVDKDINNLWNFLYFTGYLTKESERRDEEDTVYATLRVPNREVRTIYKDHIQNWFESELLEQSGVKKLYAATLSGDAGTMEGEIGGLLRRSISYMDSREAFYHGVIMGLYSNLAGYTMESNREWGDGRPDLVLLPESIRETAIILELKWTEDPLKLEARCDEAVTQIREKNYCRDLALRGYAQVIAYGIAFYRKDCVVKVYGA